jgi:hypothetical protein
MTLQDFFVSGLPTGNTAETKPQIEQQPTTTTSDQLEVDKNKPKVDKKLSIAPPKPPPKRTEIFPKKFFCIKTRTSF